MAMPASESVQGSIMYIWSQSQSWPWLRIVLASIVVLVLLSYLRVAYQPALRRIPGPTAARFTRFHRVFAIASGQIQQKEREMHKKYGPIVRLAPNYISISDPAVVPEVYGFNAKYLKTRFYDMFQQQHEGAPWVNMLSAQDATWHRNYKIPVANKFAMSSVVTLEPMADECTDIFMKKMYENVGKTLDLGEWLQWYTIDVIAAMSFKAPLGFLEQETDVKNMISGIEFGQVYQMIVGQMPEWHPWLFDNQKLMALVQWFAPSMPDPLNDIRVIAEEEIQRYREHGEESSNGDRGDFLASISREMKIGKHKLTETDILNHMFTNIFGGSDSTAISLRAIFYYLMKNHVQYSKLVQEIIQADKSGALSEHITYAESLKLTYLQAVIKEALRLHPAVMMGLPRLVPQGGSVLCGYKIPAGTEVGMNAAVIHYNTEIYGEDAASFRPERWLDSDLERIRVMDRMLMTFGRGSRDCIGKNIALMEIGKLVPQLLRKFDIEWASEKPDWEVNVWWFARQRGMIARLTEREQGNKFD